MNASLWLSKLEHADPSYLLLATLAGTSLLAGVLHRIGLIGWVLRSVGLVVKGAIRGGLPALGASARVGFVAGVPGDRHRFSRWWAGWPVVCGRD